MEHLNSRLSCIQENPSLIRGDYAKLFHKKICLLLTIIRLQLNLKSYIHSYDDASMDNDHHKSKTRKERKVSYNYYQQQLSTGDGIDITLSLNNLVLQQEFNVKQNKASSLPKWFKSITRIAPEERSDSDISKMRSHLEIKQGDFLKKLDINRQKIFCRYCRYAWYEKKRILVKAGHKGEFLYYIYNGSVSVTIEHIVDDVTTINLKPGTIFGELSLLYGIRRSATLKCESNVDVLYVDEEVTKLLFPDKLQVNMDAKLLSLKNSGIFSGWLEDNLINMSITSKIEHYPYGNLIHDNTVRSQFVYLVIGGRVEIMYKVVTQQDALCAMSQQHSLNARSKQKLPRLSSNHNSALSQSSLQQQFGYVSIDHLIPYSIVHIQCLFSDSNDVTSGLTIISRGAEVMRIPKLYLRRTATPSYWKSLQLKSLEAKRYPSPLSLQKTYMEKIRWLQYRSAVCSDVLDAKRNYSIATKPASEKGISGWTKIQSKKIQNGGHQAFSDCLGSSVPIHLHTPDTHAGRCLKRIPTRWVPKDLPQSLSSKYIK